jgi:hypothetical protein
MGVGLTLSQTSTARPSVLNRIDCCPRQWSGGVSIGRIDGAARASLPAAGVAVVERAARLRNHAEQQPGRVTHHPPRVGTPNPLPAMVLKLYQALPADSGTTQPGQTAGQLVSRPRAARRHWPLGRVSGSHHWPRGTVRPADARAVLPA